MGQLLWKLKEHLVRLQADQLSAAIDLLKPQQGLSDINYRGMQLSSARLLAIDLGHLPTQQFGRLAERYARGADLVAAYEQPAASPLHIDALWRVVAPWPRAPLATAIELIVSVRTHLLEAQPDLHVHSIVPAEEVLRPAAAADGVAHWSPLPGEESRVLQPCGGPGCLLWRLPGGELSYAEMIHPADFQRDEFSGGRQDHRLTSVRHGLFADRLEKGVMLRARVRGVLMPRHQDQAVAAECYAVFAAADPPLDA